MSLTSGSCSSVRLLDDLLHGFGRRQLNDFFKLLFLKHVTVAAVGAAGGSVVVVVVVGAVGNFHVTIVFGDGFDQVVGLTGRLPLVLCTLKVLVLGLLGFFGCQSYLPFI